VRDDGSLVVDGRALAADLTLVPGEHLRLAEAAHGLGELVGELLGLLVRERLDEPGRPGVRQQRLVRVQQPLPVQQVLVVLVVERRGRLAVQLHVWLRCVASAAGGAALALQEVAVLPVQRACLPALAQPRPHASARRAPDRVSSCIYSACMSSLLALTRVSPHALLALTTHRRARPGLGC
jgi:hypothetical protein